MRFFFRSRQFKIIVIVLAVIIVLTSVFGFMGFKMSPQANIAGTVAAPFQKAVTAVKNAITDFTKAYENGNDLLIKNSELQSQIDELNKKLADYTETVEKNKFYENFLGIKEKNPDFKFCPASVITRDASDPYGGFTVNKGSLNDISEHDPVITEAGLVGYITEVGLTTSKIKTLLNPDLTIGALDNRTQDSGIVSGSLQLAENGLCRLHNLARSCNVAIGDYVVTSGEGVFPDGLLIGKIEEISSDKYNTSIYANIKPFADIKNLREVMVITHFDGQISKK